MICQPSSPTSFPFLPPPNLPPCSPFLPSDAILPLPIPHTSPTGSSSHRPKRAPLHLNRAPDTRIWRQTSSPTTGSSAATELRTSAARASLSRWRESHSWRRASRRARREVKSHLSCLVFHRVRRFLEPNGDLCGGEVVRDAGLALRVLLVVCRAAEPALPPTAASSHRARPDGGRFGRRGRPRGCSGRSGRRGRVRAHGGRVLPPWLVVAFPVLMADVSLRQRRRGRAGGWREQQQLSAVSRRDSRERIIFFPMVGSKNCYLYYRLP